MRLLVVNAGSSSLKLSVLDDHDRAGASTALDAPGGAVDEQGLTEAVSDFGPVDATVHRMVHGGVEFRRAVVVDDAVVRRLEALVDLAPLHQPRSLRALRLLRRALPGLPAVACFDTAFHATLPPAAATYALPEEWRERFQLRRFGFHGLSHAYAARRAAEVLGRPLGKLRLVTCHLGAGASLAAVRHGASVDTTMGFTPLDGLVMATRSGTVDPGLLLWLVEHAGTPPAELAGALEHRSGLLGLAGTADMREVLGRAAAGRPEARLALDVYLHRLRAMVAGMVAAMGGVDALVFTGGVGEHAPLVRAEVVTGLAFLGAAIDRDRNDAGPPDRLVGPDAATVQSVVVEAREDLQMAAEARPLLAGAVDER